MRAIFSALAFATFASALAQVKIGSTTFVGTTQGLLNSVEFFGGIPYAEPPVGQLRFANPVLKTSYSGLLVSARDYGKKCIGSAQLIASDHSEDCLFINIHRPAGVSAGANLPVLFWIYGGGFSIGDSNTYDGKEIVEQSIKRGTPIIYVNINYRLSALGFPQGQESENANVLNLGLKDQVTALRWVQANIAAFGGDKNKVTIFGESAGSASVAIFLTNPNILPALARGAIMESGSPNGAPAFRAADRELAWQAWIRKIPACASLATSGAALSCLRQAPSSQIVDAIATGSSLGLGSGAPTLDIGSFVFFPVIDPNPGSLTPDFATNNYNKGYIQVPFIAGTNLDEGTLSASENATSTQQLKDALFRLHSPPLVSAAQLNSTIDALLNLYPDVPSQGSPFNTGNELFGLPSSYKRQAALLGDLSFTASRRQLSLAAASKGKKSYAYLFSQKLPLMPDRLGVHHAAEIPFVYGQTLLTGVSSANRALSTTIQDYWISFAVSLDPNDGKGSSRPNWPQYTTANPRVLELKAGGSTVIPDTFRQNQIAFINANTAAFRR